MKIKFYTPIQTVMLTSALAIACAGCFLIRPAHSKNRPIHEYAADGNVAAVAQDLATNLPISTCLTMPGGRLCT
ncbi:MAG: hypothetical protein ABSA47_04185 [Verrucomicrobiota bacterium]|jgi:hypothetical protein